MIQNIISNFKIYLDRTAKSSKPKELAAIHATVLSILIGVFSAYFLFINSEIRTKQLYAMSKAEEINDIQFSRYLYFPKGIDVVMASGPTDMVEVRKLALEAMILCTAKMGSKKLEK